MDLEAPSCINSTEVRRPKGMPWMDSLVMSSIAMDTYHHWSIREPTELYFGWLTLHWDVCLSKLYEDHTGSRNYTSYLRHSLAKYHWGIVIGNTIGYDQQKDRWIYSMCACIYIYIGLQGVLLNLFPSIQFCETTMLSQAGSFFAAGNRGRAT